MEKGEKEPYEQLERDAEARRATTVLEPKFNHRRNRAKLSIFDAIANRTLLMPGDAKSALGHPMDDRM